MIYQKIFTGEQPYYIRRGAIYSFPEHRHADFEFNFCLDGEFDMTVDKGTYRIHAGSTTVIPPMCSHGVPRQSENDNIITLIVGMSLLKSHFVELSRLMSAPAVLDLKCDKYKCILDLFTECAEALLIGDSASEILITGNIYKILAYLMKELSCAPQSTQDRKDYRRVENIERALELIRNNYKEPLTIEHVASITGYSKSNFCKIFKNVVGESFHQALNRQRVSNAAGLLTVTDMSVSEISAEVGFSEPKAFCRVFKEVCGVSPGQYKKAKK